MTPSTTFNPTRQTTPNHKRDPRNISLPSLTYRMLRAVAARNYEPMAAIVFRAVVAEMKEQAGAAKYPLPAPFEVRGARRELDLDRYTVSGFDGPPLIVTGHEMEAICRYLPGTYGDSGLTLAKRTDEGAAIRLEFMHRGRSIRMIVNGVTNSFSLTEGKHLSLALLTKYLDIRGHALLRRKQPSA